MPEPTHEGVAASGHGSDTKESGLRREAFTVAEEFVAHALAGESWETRDTDGQEPCWVERGVGDACERFIEEPLSYLEACKIEALLVVARGD